LTVASHPHETAVTDAVVASDRVGKRTPAPTKLADGAYAQLKKDIFDFRLVPGDRFSEAEVAERLGISRTPVREALFRLQREGYLDVTARSGWVVLPLDFELFDHLCDLRMVLEIAAVRRLCDRHDDEVGEEPDVQDAIESDPLEPLRRTWLVAPEERLTDSRRVAELDDGFSMALVAAAGNPEITRVHREVTERIRIIRHLDFTQTVRVGMAYDARGKILLAILTRRADEASTLLKAHLEAGKVEARKITLHGLQTATRGPLGTSVAE
jgi:DNA-binding GntR family transcriptional regulator